MDTDYVEEIVSISNDSQSLDNILCQGGVGDVDVKPEYYDIEDMSSNNCIVQTIESSYFTHSNTRKDDFNNMTRAVMESVPYNDGLQYLAAISSFSDNFKVVPSLKLYDSVFIRFN